MGMDIDVLTVGAVIYLMKTSIKEGCDIRNRSLLCVYPTLEN